MNEREIEMGVAGTHKSWHNQVRSFGILIFKDESYFIWFFHFIVQGFGLDICWRIAL